MKLLLLNPDADIKEKVSALFNGTHVQVVWADTPQNADITFNCGRESFVGAIAAGGKLPCAKIFDIADTLQISKKKAGQLMNTLKIKIVSCQLGCF